MSTQIQKTEPHLLQGRDIVRSGQFGFTLIELIMVIVIIGALAVAVLPRMTDLSGFAQRGLYDQAQSALRYARSTAIAQRRWVKVSDQGTGFALSACGGTGGDACNADTAACTLPVLDPATAQSYSVSGVSHDSAYSGQFFFDCDGRPQSVSGVISYTVEGGFAFYVEPETGYVHQ